MAFATRLDAALADRKGSIALLLVVSEEIDGWFSLRTLIRLVLHV